MIANQKQELRAITARFSKYRKQTGKSSGYPLELKERATNLYRSGLSANIIASGIKVHFTTVIYWHQKIWGEKKQKLDKSLFTRVKLVEADPEESKEISILTRNGHRISGLRCSDIIEILQQVG